MHRQWLLDHIKDYEARFPDELETSERFKQFVAAHDDCFERTCLPGHVTGSAWIIDQAGQRILLTHHRKLNMWIQLGGTATAIRTRLMSRFGKPTKKAV